LLRSYDSRAEPAPEFNCTIWQAGRATSATGLAFKPIQIGQSVFIDEGAGQYNPAPFVLDEATLNEWPGREVGVFISIGTGKRPAGSDANQHLWYEDFMGEFAEARRRLVAKIEGCETTHQEMLRDYLRKRGVDPENYYRLNVEIGVGEFGMNEWNRLADISTGTRRYLGKPEVQKLNLEAAAKLGKIYRAKMRLEGRESKSEQLTDIPEANPFAVELPAEVPPQPDRLAPRPSYESYDGHENLTVQPVRLSPRTSGSPRTSDEHRRDEQRRKASSPAAAGTNASTSSTSVNSPDDRFVVNAPTPSQYRTASGQDKIAIVGVDEYPRPQIHSQNATVNPSRQSPPPLPPKTPILDGGRLDGSRLDGGNRLDGSRPPVPERDRRRLLPPYPLDDGPPPAVNMARKPEYNGR
jgi:hypothetical protein